MDEKEETSKGMCEPRRVSARVAAGSLAAGGQTVDQYPCEGRENVAKRVVKQAVRRLLPFVGAHGNSLGLGPPEAGRRNAASTPLYGSSTSIPERPARGAPANEVSYNAQQQQDAQNPQKSPKQGFLSKMLALFRGPGLPASASETATAVPVSTFDRARVEPPTTSRPRSSEHPQGSHFVSLPAVLDGSQAGLPHAPRPVKRPATCLRDPPASGAAHLWQQPTVMPTHDPAPSWQFLVSPTQSGTSSQDGAPPLQQEMIIEDVEMEDLSDAIGESLSQQVPLTDFKGTYVVTDTNIFLSSLDLIERIVWPDTGNEDMVLCIPWMAIQELDNIKNRKKGPLSNSAKCAITFIYEVLSSKNPRLRGQTVVEARRIDDTLCKDGSNINDDHFLHCCLEVKKQGSKVLLMSNDRNLRNKAMINGIDTVSADEMAKKLGPPIVKRDCRWTSPSASSAKQEKPSLLLSKDSGFRFGAWQKQKEAAKETSAESNIPTCSIPSRVPDEGTILMEVREILRRSLDLVLQSELESAFGALWLRVIKFKPPWTAETALQCILRHWIALTGTAFKTSMKPVMSHLLSKLSSNCGAGECASTAELAMQLCSELQLHYPQLAGDVARLKQLSESQQASPGSAAAELDGQSSTPSGLAYSRPPLNANTGMRSSDGLHNETRGQQKTVPAGQPQTPVAHGLPCGPSRGQQGVVERRPLRPPKEAQLGVPQSLPQQSRLSIPCDVFEDSFPTLNDYWQSSTPSGLAYSRPPLNANTGMRSSDGLHNETRGQQNAVAAGQPLTPAAHGLPRGPSRGQQGVVERRPFQPPQEAQLGVPQSPPPRPRLSTPYELFQDSFAILNDYCGTVISKMNVDYHHEHPFHMLDGCKTDYASIISVYKTVVRLLDHMTYVVKNFATPREKVLDLAEAIIKGLNELLQMLHHEKSPEGQARHVLLFNMADFLVNPANRSHMIAGKRQIESLHNSLSHIALHALSQLRH